VERFTKNSGKIETMTLEDITKKVTLEDLHIASQEKLVKEGISELFPVQQATYDLFVQGRELIVKSRTGTGKTLAFLLPLETLIKANEEERESGTKNHAMI